MLDPKVFDLCINKMNALLSKNAMVVNPENLVYYEALRHVDNYVFEAAMNNLISTWENANQRPTPANILNEINKLTYGGLSKEEFFNVAMVHTLYKTKSKSSLVNHLLEQVDKESLKNGELLFSPQRQLASC